MHNRLQELTEKLYNEGLEKGRQEAEILLAQTKDQIRIKLKEAQAKADAIIAEASKKALDMERMTKEDLRQAAKSTLSSVQQQVEKVVLQKTIDGPTAKAAMDVEFVEKSILAAIQAWNPKGADPVELSVLLPESMQNQLEVRINSSVHAELMKGVEISFSPKINGGFKIGPKDGSYFVSFSSSDFANLFKSFMRPRMQKYLFE